MLLDKQKGQSDTYLAYKPLTERVQVLFVFEHLLHWLARLFGDSIDYSKDPEHALVGLDLPTEIMFEWVDFRRDRFEVK